VGIEGGFDERLVNFGRFWGWVWIRGIKNVESAGCGLSLAVDKLVGKRGGGISPVIHRALLPLQTFNIFSFKGRRWV
jgi:hypothetical protein